MKVDLLANVSRPQNQSSMYINTSASVILTLGGFGLCSEKSICLQMCRVPKTIES